MSKAVLLVLSATQASRTLRLGGVTLARNWAENTAFYTVPAGKKLTLKIIGGRNISFTADSAGIPTVTFGNAQTLSYEPMSFVFPEGTIFMQNATNTNFMYSGFLDDDV